MMRTRQKHINHCTEDLNVGQIQLPALGKKAAVKCKRSFGENVYITRSLRIISRKCSLLKQTDKKQMNLSCCCFKKRKVGRVNRQREEIASISSAIDK